MKIFIELKSKIKDRKFFLDQFQQSGSKRILFVNPMLSGKYLYKSLLPSVMLKKEGIATAVTSLNDYSQDEQFTGYKALDVLNGPDADMMIKWSTHIVFPMTCQPLHDLYERIRTINEKCKCLFNLDFNVWEVPDKHPLKHIFDPDFVIPIIQDNCYFADTVLVSNGQLQTYLIHKLTDLVQSTYAGIPRRSVNDEIRIHLLPFLIDTQTVQDNVHYSDNGVVLNSNDASNKKEPPSKTEKDPSTQAKAPKKKINNKPVIKLNKVVKKVSTKKGKKGKGKRKK